MKKAFAIAVLLALVFFGLLYFGIEALRTDHEQRVEKINADPCFGVGEGANVCLSESK